MEDDIFKDPAGFENVLALRRHGKEGGDKLGEV